MIDPHRECSLWGAPRPLQQRPAIPPKSTHKLRREAMTATANPSHSQNNVPHRLPKKLAPREFSRQLDPLLSLGKFLSPAMSSVSSNAAAKKKGEIGNHEKRRTSGKARRQAKRPRFGTELRTDPVFLGLQKTRLVDPVMSLPARRNRYHRRRTIRASGLAPPATSSTQMTAILWHSAPYATYGKSSATPRTIDPTIPKKRVRPSHSTRLHAPPLSPFSQQLVFPPGIPRHEHAHTNLFRAPSPWWDTPSANNPLAG